MSGKGFVKVNVGDIFNETDDDKTQRVIEVHAERDPPIALCCSVKEENESDETEQEYALEYVEKCVKKRREFRSKGLNNSTVYDVYQMKKSELVVALQLTNQQATGSRQQLRDRLLGFLNIHSVPSDVENSNNANDVGASTDSSTTPVDNEEYSCPSPSSSPSDSSSSSSDDDSDYVPPKKQARTIQKKSTKKQTKSVSAAASTTIHDEEDTDSCPELDDVGSSSSSSDSSDEDNDYVPPKKQSRIAKKKSAKKQTESASAAASATTDQTSSSTKKSNVGKVSLASSTFFWTNMVLIHKWVLNIA